MSANLPHAAALVLALVGFSAPSAAQTSTLIASNVVVRTAPRADAPAVQAQMAGRIVTFAAAAGAPGWVSLTGDNGATIGFARQQDVQAPPVRTSALSGFLSGSKAAPLPAASPSQSQPPPQATTGGSRLAGFLRSGDSNNSNSAPVQAGGNARPLTLAALSDGRLSQAQAEYAEEQRRLAAIAEAERQAAAAERAARDAEDRAAREIERIENEQYREQERQRRQAGDAIIANAIGSAAISIGNAMADTVRADYARMQAENQRRMADANRRAAELKLAAARADAERARREAVAAANRAPPPVTSTAQRSTGIDYTARAQAQRAAEAEFRQRQAAAEQARIAQSQVAMMGSRPASSIQSRPGNTSGSPSSSASMPSSPSSSSSVSRPPSVISLDINYHDVGSGSGTRQVEQLQVNIYVKDVKVNGDKSRICADFRNPLAGEWRGGYRLSDKYQTATFASMDVGPGQTKTVCEILPVVKTYHVVLKEQAPRSRDTALGKRG